MERPREHIVKEWIGRADWEGKPEDKWVFEYEWLAIDGDAGVLDGLTDYSGRNEMFKNIWIIRLNEDGRCREFIEYWVKKGAQ
jgi:hypothetical protein